MSQVNSIEEFIERAKNIHEVDIGDFKRKMGAYINRLEDSIPQNKRSLEVKRGFMTLRNAGVFFTLDDVEKAREATIQVALSLKI